MEDFMKQYTGAIIPREQIHVLNALGTGMLHLSLFINLTFDI